MAIAGVFMIIGGLVKAADQNFIIIGLVLGVLGFICSALSSPQKIKPVKVGDSVKINDIPFGTVYRSRDGSNYRRTTTKYHLNVILDDIAGTWYSSGKLPEEIDNTEEVVRVVWTTELD